jgi:hypothetical protein
LPGYRTWSFISNRRETVNKTDDEIKAGTLAGFADFMKGLYGEDLVALYEFGESAAETNHGRRRMKLLAVLREVGPGELKKYRGAHPKWSKKGIPAPLMLTRQTLDSSTDVFPMEFLEMKETRKLLHGEDVLSSLDISLENLRRECEEQVKGKFIHLRQAYIESGEDAHALEGLIAASIEPFTDAMRNVLRLMGKEAHLKKEPAIRDFCRETGIDESPFIEALHVRKGHISLKKEALEDLYARYLGQVARMAEIIDKTVT